jgi:hypothetical protein
VWDGSVVATEIAIARRDLKDGCPCAYYWGSAHVVTYPQLQTRRLCQLRLLSQNSNTARLRRLGGGSRDFVRPIVFFRPCSLVNRLVQIQPLHPILNAAPTRAAFLLSRLRLIFGGDDRRGGQHPISPAGLSGHNEPCRHGSSFTVNPRQRIFGPVPRPRPANKPLAMPRSSTPSPPYFPRLKSSWKRTGCTNPACGRPELS